MRAISGPLGPLVPFTVNLIQISIYVSYKKKNQIDRKTNRKCISVMHVIVNYHRVIVKNYKLIVCGHFTLKSHMKYNNI